MSGTNPVAPYNKTDFTSQTSTAYKTQIDANSVAAQRIVGRFAPHAASTPNMTVVLDAGNILTGTTLTEVAQQTTSAITAPVSHPRIDRIVIDNTTGTVSVVPGSEAVTPIAPAIPNGACPVAQVFLQTNTVAITNAIIADERNFSAMGGAGFGAQTPIGSAATCDLGVALSRNVKITGMTTITSFGSSANTQSPIYLIEFAAAVTLKNGTALLLPGTADIAAAVGDTAMVEYLGAGNWRLRSYFRATGKPLASSYQPPASLDPTQSTYTTPAGCIGLLVTVMADGGGGGAKNTNSGANGSGSTFGDWNCNGGGGGKSDTPSATENGGSGGANGLNGTGSLIRRIAGQKGDMALDTGGSGGSGPWGGAGGASFGAGIAASPGSGSGGSGAGSNSNTFYGGGGGGAGEYAEFFIPSPLPNYNYSIGPGGSGGIAGTAAGGPGGSGAITVQPIYS